MDTNPEKLEDLPERCADRKVVINRDNPDVMEVIPQSQGGFDCALDFVGTPTTAQLAIDSLRKGGSAGLVGLYGGELRIPILKIISKSLSIIGSRAGSLSELKELVGIVTRSDIQPPKITAYRLGEVNEALDALRQGTMKGRGVVYMHG